MITGAPIPTLSWIVRSQLNCTKGNVCTDKHMTVVIASNVRINKPGIISLDCILLLRWNAGQYKKCRASKTGELHLDFIFYTEV